MIQCSVLLNDFTINNEVSACLKGFCASINSFVEIYAKIISFSLRSNYYFANLTAFLYFFEQGKNFMKQQFAVLALTSLVFCMMGMPALASTEQNPQTMSQATGMIDKHIRDAQAAQAKANGHKHKVKKKKKAKPGESVSSIENEVGAASTETKREEASSAPDAYVASDNTAETVSPNVINNLPIDVTVPGQSFVSSGPYIGVPFTFSGTDLIINSPSINEDVALLNVRKAIGQRLRLLGRGEESDHAHLLLSGIVEAQAIYKDPGTGPTSSDIDLTDVELDGYILGPSNWTSALFAFTYDNNIGSQEGALSSNSRVMNSRLFVSKAFIVIGNFDKSPIYGTIGQMYVPFGAYSSNMISSPLTKILGRTLERAFLLGFQQQGSSAVYGAGYVFKGETHSGATSRLNNGGFNLGYRFKTDTFSGNFGGGVIANIADSGGMQFNGYSEPQFGGFGATNNFGDELIAHRVPAMNLRGLFSIGSHVDLLAEYIGAITSFSANNLTYNSHGAKPKALTVEAAYTFTTFERPSAIALGYGKTRDALALGLALQRYQIVFNTSWWKDTLQSIEFRHDQTYAESAYATGSGSAVTQLINGAGKPDKTVIAQFDIYF